MTQILLVCVTGMTVLQASVPNVNGSELEDLIREIETHEAIYRNIECEMTYEYNCPFIKERAHINPPTADTPIRLFADQYYEWRSVVQGELFRVERRGSGNGTDGAKLTADRICGFDGRTSRVLEQSKFGNIAEFQVTEPDLVIPHMLLLKPFRIFAPLSTFLSGTAALNAYPNSNWKPHWELDVSLLGEEVVDGVTTYALKIENVIKGKPHDGYRLWLSKEHNLMPIRFQAFTYRFSSDPISFGAVSEWMELDNGLWFPRVLKVTANDPKALMEEQKAIVRWTTRVEARSVKLNPEYDAAYFAAVEFPDGIPVYTLNSEKTISESRISGDPDGKLAANIPGRGNWRIMFYFANAVIITAIVWLLIRKAQRVGRVG